MHPHRQHQAPATAGPSRAQGLGLEGLVASRGQDTSDTGLSKDKRREGQHPAVGQRWFAVQIPGLACVRLRQRFTLLGPRWYMLKPEIIAAPCRISGDSERTAQSSRGSPGRTVRLSMPGAGRGAGCDSCCRDCDCTRHGASVPSPEQAGLKPGLQDKRQLPRSPGRRPFHSKGGVPEAPDTVLAAARGQDGR